MLLKHRILASATVLGLLLTGAGWVNTKLAGSAAERRYNSAAVAGHAALWRILVDARLDRIGGVTTDLTRNRDLTNALRKGEVDAAAAAATPIFNRLSTSGVIDGLAVYAADGSSIYESAGWGRPEPMIGRVLDEKVVLRGLFEHADGLSYGVAFPLFARGQVVGVALYVSNLDAIADSFEAGGETRGDGVGGGAEPRAANDRLRVLARSATGAAIRGETAELAALAPDGGMVDAGLRVVERDGASLAVATLPLVDATGAVLGAAHVVEDWTAPIAERDRRAALSTGLLFVLSAAFIAALAVFLRAQFRPLDRAVASIARLADGETAITVPDVGRRDEIGAVARAIEALRGALAASNEAEAARSVAREKELARGRALAERCRSLDRAVGAAMSSLEAATLGLKDTAENVAKRAADGRERSERVAVASADAARLATAVAERTAGFSSAMDMIGERTVEASATLDEAVLETQKADKALIELTKASGDINRCMEIVQAIAGQTNILAMNASIEAAQAGDRGDGMAVIAREVKSLARKSRDAAESIGPLVAQVSDRSEHVEKALDRARKKMTGARDKAQEIEQRVGAQSEATAEVKTNVDGVRGEAGAIAAATDELKTVADATDAACVDVRSASEAIESQREALMGEIRAFLQDVEAA